MGCQIWRILIFNDAILYKNIAVYDSYGNVINDQCRFSWSSDRVCWTDWTDINTFESIISYLDDIYIRILIPQTFDHVLLNNMNIGCYRIILDTDSQFLQDFCSSTSLFKPYDNLDCALLLQQQMADSIVCMFGIPIYYIKVSPVQDSATYTFKEYVLHNVESIKQIKLMIRDGEMPSSNPQLTDFDFDWEVDWEVEVSKTQFATAFGDDAFPKQRDIIYIPMMKRLWTVNSAYDEKNEGLMWRSTTWKLALVKYNESTNIDSGSFDDVINTWVAHTYDEVFGEAENIEQERVTGTSQVQAPSYSANNLYDIFMEDAVRKKFTKNNIIISDKTYNHRSNTVARNIYKIRPGGSVVYQNRICGDQGTLSFIIDVNELNDCDIISFGPVKVHISAENDKCVISHNGMNIKLDQFSTYMIIIRWNRSTFVSEMSAYKYIHRDNMPVYMLRPEMYWFDFEHPVDKISTLYNNDFNISSPQECSIHGPVDITNIRLYNQYMDDKNLPEFIKYTTTDKRCVINDLARPLITGMGYAVK